MAFSYLARACSPSEDITSHDAKGSGLLEESHSEKSPFQLQSLLCHRNPGVPWTHGGSHGH